MILSLHRSVVVALRGTTSVEDIITDSVAEPEKLDPEWIPKCIRSEASGPLFAHAGIKAAADAVLKVRPSCDGQSTWTHNVNAAMSKCQPMT